ncbi:MAG: hypothetical protein H7245_14070 [Candidatus Saccharibacteria bacterium]|nr:hypothetical protein [Pseudorhodobacter sp.]
MPILQQRPPTFRWALHLTKKPSEFRHIPSLLIWLKSAVIVYPAARALVSTGTLARCHVPVLGGYSCDRIDHPSLSQTRHRKVEPMPNEPVPAKMKRSEPLHRQNAQGDHEGSPHNPEEFLPDQTSPTDTEKNASRR